MNLQVQSLAMRRDRSFCGSLKISSSRSFCMASSWLFICTTLEPAGLRDRFFRSSEDMLSKTAPLFCSYHGCCLLSFSSFCPCRYRLLKSQTWSLETNRCSTPQAIHTFGLQDQNSQNTKKSADVNKTSSASFYLLCVLDLQP